MNCTHCGHVKTTVTNTKNSRRYRKCLLCKKSFATVELPATQADALIRLREAIKNDPSLWAGIAVREGLYSS